MRARPSVRRPIGSAARSPLLFPLVYAASLSLVALSAIALAVLGREHVTQAAIEVAARSDQVVALDLARRSLSPSDLDSGDVSEATTASLATELSVAMSDHAYLAAVLLRPDGSLV